MSPDTAECVPLEAGWLKWNNPDVDGKGRTGRKVPTTSALSASAAPQSEAWHVVSLGCGSPVRGE